MIVEHAEFQVLPGAGTEFVRAVKDIQNLLLSSPGCKSVDMLQSAEEPETYLLRVGWERLEDHIEGFATSANAESFIQAVAPYCAGPPRVLHFKSVQAFY